MISVIKNFTAGKYYPSANHINCTVESNNSGNCNFRYICDVYVNGVKVFTDKLFPDPNTGKGFFQIGRVLQDYIKTYYPTATTTSLFINAASGSAPDSVLSVYCKFGEEYDSSSTCDGTVIQYANQVTSNTFYVFEGALNYEDYPTYDYTKYLVQASSSPTVYAKFLTNSPREVEVTYNDTYYLDFLYSGTMSGAYWSVNIETYDQSGNLEDTYGIAYSGTSSKKRFRVAVGPYNINKFYSGPVINQNISKYTISVSYHGQRQTEVFTFLVKPPKEYMTRLSFVGLLGGIEQFTFYHRKKTGYDIQRKTYSKLLNSNYSNDWKYAVGDRGTTVYSTRATEKSSVATYCSRDIAEWLYEMWLSPDVWAWRRSQLVPFKAYLGPGGKIYFWFSEDDGFIGGDTIHLLPSPTDANIENMNSGFIVGLVLNGNTLDFAIGQQDYPLLYDYLQNGGMLCGWLYKEYNPERLPVVISDNSVEVKQKTSKPVEYSLNYEAAYSKTTLKG